MKLYVAPGACSLSCHISFEEAQVRFEPVVCQWQDQLLWREVEKLNPQGAVPILVLDDGKILTQNLGILSYLGELAPESGLIGKIGTFDRAQIYQWLSWVAADLQKAFSPLFEETLDAGIRKELIHEVEDLLMQVDRHLDNRSYLVGDRFSAADAYLFTIYNWTRPLKLPTQSYGNLTKYAAAIAERPAVRTALKREGLLK